MSEKMNNVIFLARWYPHRYDPMFGLFVKRHAEAAAMFNKITVIYAQPVENLEKKFEAETNEDGNLKEIRVYFRKTDNKIVSIARFFKAVLKGLKLAPKPDLIHVHILTRLGVIALIHNIFHKTPYIITEHWSRYLPGNDFGGFLHRKITAFVVKKAKTVTTVTQNLATAMKNRGLKNDNYIVLPNVVDTNLFKPVEKTRDDIPHFTNISCFEDKSKNISGLLEAVAILKEKNRKFLCTLIGDGMDFEAMRQKCHDLGLDDVVKFTGMLEGEELAETLANQDFLVISSNYENLPVVILEALSCGLPIVSTDVGGINEVIGDGNGILVRKGEAETIAAAIDEMFIRYRDFQKESLREKIVAKNEKRNVGIFLTKLYGETISMLL